MGSLLDEIQGMIRLSLAHKSLDLRRSVATAVAAEEEVLRLADSERHQIEANRAEERRKEGAEEARWRAERVKAPTPQGTKT